LLDEVRARWGVSARNFCLVGHSGGGQFALRMLLHPRRLRGAAIARTPVLLTIGSEDRGEADLAAQHDPSQDGFGSARRDRLDTLARQDFIQSLL
jgi:pimeloyl-ACP methyl ester carboxylesterase